MGPRLHFCFYKLGAHAKFRNPTTTASVVLNSGGKNNNKSGIIPKIVASFVSASSQGQRTHSTRTKIVAYLSCSAGRTHFARTKIDTLKAVFRVAPATKNQDTVF
jgi:hypothetical protein